MNRITGRVDGSLRRGGDRIDGTLNNRCCNRIELCGHCMAGLRHGIGGGGNSRHCALNRFACVIKRSLNTITACRGNGLRRSGDGIDRNLHNRSHS